jgi:recombination protein RecA
VAEAQRLGGTAAFIDAEHALDPKYCEAIGVKLDELLLSQPSSGEQALEIMEALVRSGAVDVIVVDSVAALVPEAELQGQMGEAQVGLQARLMSQAMRKLAAAIAQSKTVAVFVNQIRAAIQPGPFGPATTTTGGAGPEILRFRSPKHLVRRKIAEGDERVGMKARVRVVKSKVAPPYREAAFDIVYGRGIVKERDILNTGVEWGRGHPLRLLVLLQRHPPRPGPGPSCSVPRGASGYRREDREGHPGQSGNSRAQAFKRMTEEERAWNYVLRLLSFPSPYAC